jgi:Protein of unknown function (DUF1214)
VRGADLAVDWIGSIGVGLIRLPGTILARVSELRRILRLNLATGSASHQTEKPKVDIRPPARSSKRPVRPPPKQSLPSARCVNPYLGDESGKTLDGANTYTVHFDKGATPPANAFWAITFYDEEGFQVPNSLNRFAVSS